MNLVAALCSVLLGALLTASGTAAAAIPSHYDASIERASERWLPVWHWSWLKAQLYAESRLDPAAVSRVGARGVAQLMPRTHVEIAAVLRSGTASPHDVEYAVEAAAYYMARMRRIWKSPRPEEDRRRLAQASYNAGAGHIIAAQRRCTAKHPVRAATTETIGDGSGIPVRCVLWADIAPHLIAVTGRANSAETLGYVARIARIQAQL